MLNFDWLSNVSPETAKIVFLALFGIIGVLVLLLPREYIYRGVAREDRHWYNNLKLWALGVLAILFFTYYQF
jgi:hypothetical protein